MSSIHGNEDVWEDALPSPQIPGPQTTVPDYTYLENVRLEAPSPMAKPPTVVEFTVVFLVLRTGMRVQT